MCRAGAAIFTPTVLSVPARIGKYVAVELERLRAGVDPGLSPLNTSQNKAIVINETKISAASSVRHALLVVVAAAPLTV